MSADVSILAGAGGAAIVTAGVLVRVANRPGWRATVTPLASIIGSGFLVAAPLLVGAFGGAAPIAMAGLLILSYLLGHVMRFNIRYGEPLLAREGGDRVLRSIEAMSSVALAFAYVISVTYYLVLLGSFALAGIGLESELGARLAATAVLIGIGVLGIAGGLRAVERAETIVVSIKLIVIAALCAALAVAYFTPATDGASWPAWQGLTLAGIPGILGLLIVTQGFETSRYLGSEFDAPTRISGMRRAQWISAAIYLGFVGLVTPLLVLYAAGDGVTGILDVAAKLAVGMAAVVTLGAGASQFTAAVADSLAFSGLANEISRGRLAAHLSYIVLIPLGIAIVWLTDVTELIAYASRAFAAYYALQCALAVRVVTANGATGHRRARLAGYTALTLVALAIAVVGAPVAE